MRVSDITIHRSPGDRHWVVSIIYWDPTTKDHQVKRMLFEQNDLGRAIEWAKENSK